MDMLQSSAITHKIITTGGHMAKKRRVRVAAVRPATGRERTPNVVEEAIAKFEGSPSSLASQLSKFVGREVTRQRVHGWRLRGVFPRDMMVAVHHLTGIPLERLIEAKPREHDQGNVVNRAIRLKFGAEDGTAAQLAAELSKMSGRKITRQMVNNWRASEQFPVDMAPFVHMLTGIPIKDLVETGHSRKR